MNYPKCKFCQERHPLGFCPKLAADLPTLSKAARGRRRKAVEEPAPVEAVGPSVARKPRGRQRAVPRSVMLEPTPDPAEQTETAVEIPPTRRGRDRPRVVIKRTTPMAPLVQEKEPEPPPEAADDVVPISRGPGRPRTRPVAEPAEPKPRRKQTTLRRELSELDDATFFTLHAPYAAEATQRNRRRKAEILRLYAAGESAGKIATTLDMKIAKVQNIISKAPVLSDAKPQRRRRATAAE